MLKDYHPHERVGIPLEVFTTAQKNILIKRKMSTMEELLAVPPKKYFDFSHPYDVEYTEEMAADISKGKYVAIKGRCVNAVSKVASNGSPMIKVTLLHSDPEINSRMTVIIFGGAYVLRNININMMHKEILVGGAVSYDEKWGLSMMAPVVCEPYSEGKAARIYPVYPKRRGISEEKFLEGLKYAYNIYALKPRKYIPYEPFRKIHFPENLHEVNDGMNKLISNDMLYFAVKLEYDARRNNLYSDYKMPSLSLMESFIGSFPYTLTDDQRNCVYGMIGQMQEGKRVSGLVQGDVGCGKTVVAFALMVCAAGNGCQAALMAPTSILAKQHYEELRGYAEKLGLNARFLTGDTPAKEKKIIYDEIASGKCSLIVGTHACISRDVKYRNLAITIVDEEHRFGVLQREAIMEKGKSGTHNIIMSATPIPRSLAGTIYGNNTSVYTIRQMPGGRKPVKTAVVQEDRQIFSWMYKEIKEGRQCYVVCPLIDEAEEGSKMEGIASVESVTSKYREVFAPYGISVEMVTGKMDKAEQERIIGDFKENRVQVLVATTVIEVGVNVPNASVIVITGAERFGLATLHQLRGRVGRGIYQGYCMLQQSDSSVSANLNVLCSTNDGFEVAKADMENRGTGEITGTRQSGQSRYIEYIFRYPGLNKKAKEYAVMMCDRGEAEGFIREYEEAYPVRSGK